MTDPVGTARKAYAEDITAVPHAHVLASAVRCLRNRASRAICRPRSVANLRRRRILDDGKTLILGMFIAMRSSRSMRRKESITASPACGHIFRPAWRPPQRSCASSWLRHRILRRDPGRAYRSKGKSRRSKLMRDLRKERASRLFGGRRLLPSTAMGQSARLNPRT